MNGRRWDTEGEAEKRCDGTIGCCRNMSAELHREEINCLTNWKSDAFLLIFWRWGSGCGLGVPGWFSTSSGYLRCKRVGQKISSRDVWVLLVAQECWNITDTSRIWRLAILSASNAAAEFWLPKMVAMWIKLWHDCWWHRTLISTRNRKLAPRFDKWLGCGGYFVDKAWNCSTFQHTPLNVKNPRYEIFALLGRYAAFSGSYRRFGTTDWPPSSRIKRYNAAQRTRRTKIPFRPRR